MPIPCSCCPLTTDSVRCYDSGATVQVVNKFDASQVVATSPGAVYVIIPTHDGTVSSALTGIPTSPAGTTSVQSSIIDYFYSVPRNNVTDIRLFNQIGGILNDADGLSNATIVTLFDISGAVLFTGPLNAVNGGAAQLTPVGNLDGVVRLRLSNITKQVNGTVAPGWREIDTLSQNPVPRSAVAVNCDGEIVWYDLITELEIPLPITFIDCP